MRDVDLGKARSADTLAQRLGWFSIGLGVAQILAPKQVARLIGVTDGDQRTGLMRAVGVREIAAGVGLLTDAKPTGFAMARVAGDLMDLAMLGNALSSSKNDRGKTMLATAAVLGVGALDVLCSEQLATTVPRVTHPAKSSESVHIRKSVTVARPVDAVYGFWRDFENLPQFMPYLESVRNTGDRRSRWTAKPVGGRALEWDVEIAEDRENQLIAWRTVGVSELSGRGAVEFVVAPGGRGTEVHAELRFDPPGGPIGARFARLFRDVPGVKLENNLNLFKQILETGEVVRSDASVHDRPHPAQPARN